MLANSQFSLQIARTLVVGKLRNSKALLERIGRGRQSVNTRVAAENIRDLMEASRQSTSVDSLRGYEGAAAKEFYEAYSQSFKYDWSFRHRTRRPPRDPVNSLLSLGYTLVFYQIVSFLRASGLNPYVGYLHSIGRDHPALASDLIEEFRAPIVESLVLYMYTVNSKVLSMPDFTTSENGCFLSTAARKKFLMQFDRKIRTPIVHPRSGARMDYRGIMAMQVHAMANTIRGAVSAYIPFEMR